MPRLMSPDVIDRQVFVGQIDLSPDGETVVYTRRTVRGGRDRIGLHTVPYAGGGSTRLTDGAWCDTAPSYSPDGRWIAFLSDRKGGVAQLFLVAARGGAVRQLTRCKRGVRSFDWRPDGRALVLCVEDDASHMNVGGRGGSKPEAPTARVIRRIDWRLDGTGLLDHARHAQLLELDERLRPVGPLRRLTQGDWSLQSPKFSPDGTRVGYLADPRPEAQFGEVCQVFSVPAVGGEPTQLTRSRGSIERFAWEDDESLIVIARSTPEPPDDEPALPYRVWAGGAVVKLVPEGWEWFCGGGFGGDTNLHDWWTDGGDDGRVTVAHLHGRAVPFAFEDDGPVALVDPAGGASMNWVRRRAGRTVATLTVGAAAPEIYALESPARPRRITREGGYLRPYGAPLVEELSIPSPGGPIQTFVVSPPGAGREALATVLDVHGGPTGAWGPTPPLEALLLASNGYRVVLPNIRGSLNQGRPWIRALRGKWGGPDAEDCHAVLDHLVDAGLADPARLGVMGLSYGGFVTNWLVATSGRFAAAVSENGVTNQVSDWGNSDCGYTYCRNAGLGDVLSQEGVDLLWEQSPLKHVANVQTPILLLQAESDLRCPAGDNEQFFIALKVLRRTVEYVLYPEEAHVFQGSGRADRRKDRHRRVLEWFQRHMPA